MNAHAEQVALVTGAYRGIGLEVSRQLALRGFRVVLTARDRRKSEGAADALKAPGPPVVPFPLDVTGGQGVEAARLFVEERFGRPDVPVNNAAILYDSWQRAETADLETVRERLAAGSPRAAWAFRA